MLMISQKDGVERCLAVAKDDGHKLETTRSGLRQINFGHKKRHEDHLNELFPEILATGKHIPTLIDKVAQGRPCVHKPMRKIVEKIKRDLDLK